MRPVALLLLAACAHHAAPRLAGFSTPQATFDTLQRAVADHDIDLYARCFSEETADREGRVSDLRADPSGWEELAGVLRPPLTLVMDGTAPADAALGSRWHGSVRAPKADGGGVGGLTFVRTELGWVIRTW